MVELVRNLGGTTQTVADLGIHGGEIAQQRRVLPGVGRGVPQSRQ